MDVDGWIGGATTQMLSWAGSSLSAVVVWLAPALAFYFLVDLLRKGDD